jgi:predicted dehydrogenase
MINIGLIGYGHWGPDHARIFNGQVDSLVVAVADPDERRLAAAQDQIPFVSATSDHRILLDHPEVTTVVIATPLRTHFGLTREALLADKGVLMEKPLCFTAREAQELCDLVYPEMSRDQVEQVVACLRRALAS